MPARPSSPGAAIAPGRPASLLAMAVLLLAFTFGPAPARAASTVVFGPLVAGGSQAIDVELPLALSIASVPASYDGVVIFTTADPALVIGFGAFGFSMPIRVGQLRTQFPAATIAFPAPTVAFDNPGGGFALASLGCTPIACSYRATFTPPARAATPRRSRFPSRASRPPAWARSGRSRISSIRSWRHSSAGSSSSTCRGRPWRHPPRRRRSRCPASRARP